ncbi:diguanylate cyclase [Vogesella sp. LIG4]|uniref:GGDEF domain-containing protein n=1 Tax=Vogesella sp. LIG4 TaxID=1192162 RepID=UPI00081FBDEF|nr:diguanylate cyclase [Vogesella sp. LIG4]SCK21108.1 PAS domain S-box-containing protein/diguanylate cyclase (GGDEF) domain-containing protein [Vogesella sp. LIG4]
MTSFEILHALGTPVWIVQPDVEETLFANRAAQALSGESSIAEMRHGRLSARTHDQLAAYTPQVLAREQVVEIWTVQQQGAPAPLSCRLSALSREGQPDAVLVEGVMSAPATVADAAAPQMERNFHDILFGTNTAPMLLIDPANDGRIVDANESARRFYGYSREEFSCKHTWEINSLGRDVLPVMHEVAKLPGGHKPLNFVHRLADGSLRDVQTYAGPIVLNGRRLMLCVIHDITEQQRLKTELEQAALRDPLTGLWNRRHLLRQLEHARLQKRLLDQDYSLLLLDADHFKDINDRHGHFCGDEVLVQLARTFEARVRGTDSVYRWGGEEFVILLPHTRLESAELVAENLRTTVEQLQQPGLPQVTVSIGVAQHHGDETVESLIKRVDNALYQAKSQGRNRVITV